VPISPARQIAFSVLCRVESGRSFAVDMLQERSVSELSEADRRLATEIVMGALRWRGELDFQIERLSGKTMGYFDAEVATILRMSVYQIRFLEKIPPSAVVNEAVELTKAARKRSAAGLVNAVLRKCRPPASRAATEEELRRSFPAWLRARWERNFGPEAFADLVRASNAVPPTTLRVSRGERDEIRRRLAQEGIETKPGRFSDCALIVKKGNVQTAEAYRSGAVVIQDEASQLVAALLAPRPGERVLDLCAAPGIKTGQTALALGRGLLVACDVSAPRLRTMRKLLRVPDGLTLHTLRLDATRELPFGAAFDRILVDVPCSGTGTLARNPEIKWRMQASDLERLAEVQARILRNALKVLVPGGRLVYSTCSLEPEENEQVVERVLQETAGFRMLAADELASDFPQLKSLFDTRGCFRTRPDLHQMDGFFAAVITCCSAGL